MAVLTIRVVPDPFLRKRAREIRVINDSVRKLARDMVETMQAAHGVGLAANQVGVLKRLIVLQMPEEEPRIMVNPEITKREGERQIEEGCLSVPGYIGLVTRSIRVRARALDEMGAKLRLSAEELLAQAIEHEVDHLNGMLYLDHLVAHEQLRKVEPETAKEEGGEGGALRRTPDTPSTGSGQAAAPHMHDVTFELRVDHSDGKHADKKERDPGLPGQIEVLSSRAKLAGLTSDASLSDLAFDITAVREPHAAAARPAKKAAAKRAPATRRRVRSVDPALDGGVILEKPSRARRGKAK